MCRRNVEERNGDDGELVLKRCSNMGGSARGFKMFTETVHIYCRNAYHLQAFMIKTDAELVL